MTAHIAPPAAGLSDQPVTPVGRAGRSVAARASVLSLVSVALIVVAAIAGLGLGAHPVSPAAVWQAVTAYDPTNNDHLIVVSSRVPRILLGLLVGAALGLAGALMQSLTRNPLADPGILGINAGASACVAVAIAYLGVTQISQYIWFAFVGAALTAVLVFALGTAHQSVATPVRIAVAGTAVAIAITAFTQMVLISNETAFNLFRYWSVGSVQGRGMDIIAAVAPFVAVGVLCALLLGRQLNAITLGDDAARSLGVRVGATRAGTMVAVVLLAGAATAAAGPIGFVGLAAAHLVRRWVGNDHRYLLPCSLLLGAAILVIADTLGRAVSAPADLQTGIAAAIIGGPVFIALVRSRRVVSL